MFAPNQTFETLIAEVAACRSCERMCDSVRVLSWANGAPGADVMFVAEAPGRLGADRTLIPLHGDSAGHNFERLLSLSGLRRSQVFITNAVLCNPKDGDGNNAPPSSREIENCTRHLASQIETIRPSVIVTLGAVALRALSHLVPHGLSLAEHVRTSHAWNGRLLIPLYHPGARALIHRSFAKQTSDYYFVGEAVRRLERKSRRRKPESMRGAGADWAVVRMMLETSRELSLFRLHKLLYLTDLESTVRFGHRATGFLYLRQKDGPYCVELGSRWYNQFDGCLRLGRARGQPWLSWVPEGLFDNLREPSASDDLALLVAEMVSRTSDISDAQLKTRAYLTAPMKELLRREKLGESTLNRPLMLHAA